MAAAHISRDESGAWSWLQSPDLILGRLHKVPGLQGPIDDAFMSRFCFVRPLGSASMSAAEKWAEFEMEHAVHRWEAVFRGSPLTVGADDVDDLALTEMDCNIVLWGSPATNPHLATLFAKIQSDSSIRWDDSAIAVGSRTFDAGMHALVMVYPSPWSPGRYVVVNSCVTHREEDDRTNALQNPKLPDWAVIDLSEAPTSDSVGRVAAADFFDEHWGLKTSNGLASTVAYLLRIMQHIHRYFYIQLSRSTTLLSDKILIRSR